MNDPVERAAVIDALGWGNEWDVMGFTVIDKDDAIRQIKSLPSAQPEIIRCKDCKYMTEHYDTDGNAPYWTCSEWDSGTDYDGFCHYAERREE